MALTKEQFLELRKKGLSVEQITRFEAGETPETSTIPPEPNSRPKLGTWDGFFDPFKQTGLGIAKGAGKLALGVGTIGRTIQEGVGRVAGVDLAETSIFDTGSEARSRADEALKADTTGQKIASTITEIGATIAPSSAAVKATSGLGFAKAMLGRAGTGATVGTIQGGGDIDRDTAIGAVAETAFPVVGKTLSFGSKVIKNAAAGISGKGTNVIDEILQNPQAAREGLRGVASRADDAATIRKSVSNIAKAASDEFAESLEALPKRLGRSPKVLQAGGATTIKVDGNTYKLSLKGLKSQMTQSMRQFDVKVDPRKKTFDFTEAPLDRAEEGRLREVFDVVQSWKDTSPAGLHRLSRKISNYRRSGEQSAELNAIVDRLSTSVHKYIGKRIPAAQSMLDDYSKAQDTIEVFNKEFATKGRLVGGTADRIGTEKKVGNLFSGEKTTGTKYLETYVPGGQNIPAREAGRLMAEDITRSGASIGDFLRTAVNTVISPKTVGEFTALTGIAVEKAAPMLNRLKDMEPVARAATIEFLTDLLGEGEGQNQSQTTTQTAG